MNQQSPYVRNFIWFLTSVLLAIVIWFIASLEVNPITEQPFEDVPVDVLIDENMIITSVSTENVDVTVRSPETVREDDIIVQADLRGREPATYTIPLNVEVAVTASGETQPRQITVVLEQAETRLKPIVIDVTNPALSFSVENLQHEMQAEVRGSLDAVTAVTSLRASLDLSVERSANTIERTVTLSAVDENGNEVSNVTIEPRTIPVSVDIVRSDDVREIAVNPRILFDELPENYSILSFDYEPRSVFISGSPEALERLGDTLDTQPISLEGRIDDFDTTVALDLPDESLIVVSETGAISVQVEIAEQTTSIVLENIPVSVVGAPEDMIVRANPETISIILSGPISILDGIVAEDVQVIVTPSTIEPGTVELTPQVSIRQGGISLEQISVTLLPQQVSVTITAPTPEATEAATAEPTPSGN